MPALACFIGEELAKEAAISKGKLKAHELRESLKKLGNNNGKNKNKKEEGE